MKPFQDYDLSKVLDEQRQKIHKKIDSMGNEEIMANDLEILAENIYQEFFIEPVEIYEEDFSKRVVRQGKIQKYVDPFFSDYHKREYVEVDGIIASFSFPYTGESELFKCRASTFSLSGYTEIQLSKKDISIKIERSLSEMDTPTAKNDLLAGVNRSIEWGCGQNPGPQ